MNAQLAQIGLGVMLAAHAAGVKRPNKGLLRTAQIGAGVLIAAAGATQLATGRSLGQGIAGALPMSGGGQPLIAG